MQAFRLAFVAAATAAALLPTPDVWAETDGLHDRPVLVLDPGLHTAPIRSADVDAAGTLAVTGSHDKTVRLWSVADGRLLRTIRVPAGPGDVGKIYAVALSPDGSMVAAGGWTAKGPPAHIYLFEAATGALIKRIGRLPQVVNHLAFSPDGRRLVATLAGTKGMRIFGRDENWREIARDADYGRGSYGAAFAPDGRLATTSDDGRLRLYDAGGALVRVRSVATGRLRPYGVTFSPDGGRIAVGFFGGPVVRLYDGRTLDPLPAPDTSGLDNGALFQIAWSADGATLYAAGSYDVDGGSPVVAWAGGGNGKRRILPAGLNSVSSLRPLPSGALFVAAQDPWLGVLVADGTPRWRRTPVQMDARAQHSNFAVSADGTVVDFGVKQWGKDRARFDATALTLVLDPAADGRTAPPVQKGLPVADWINSRTPTLDGKPLPLERNEYSRSLAVHPDGERFVLGADWQLRAFDAAGKGLWRWDVPGVVWAVNISGDGRFTVAAYHDGTIRWHRMADGAEQLAFFPFNDKRNWVAWEPDGRFYSTLGARSALRWHVNKGWDEAPVTLPAHSVPKSWRPEVIKRVLPQGGTMRAVYAAEETERKLAIKRLTGAEFAPGAQLHMLTVGISVYGPKAPGMALEWADEDAVDLNAALTAQTADLWPYQRGFSMTLRDDEAKGLHILDQLKLIRERMAAAPGKRDLAVIHFSGHGTVVGEGAAREFYLLPYDADTRSDSRIQRTGLSGTELRRQIAAIAEHGKVLLLLDACRSGAVAADGKALSLDAALLRRSLAGRNVTVLTSSDGTQSSWENKKWRNGAFTEIVLEALGRAADANNDGMVNVEELVGHVVEKVGALTGGKQTPQVEMRFSGPLFASRF